MLVIIIIAVISAVVFARLDRIIPSQALVSAANQVAGAAALARSEARLKRVDVELVYDIDKGTWAIQEPSEIDPVTGIALPAPKTVTMASGTLPEGVKIARVYYSESGVASDGIAAPTFRPSGAVSEHMVVLENAEKSALAVYVPALTGSAFVVTGDASYAEIRAHRRAAKE